MTNFERRHLATETRAEIITDFCLSLYIDLINIITKPGNFWASKQNFGGATLGLKGKNLSNLFLNAGVIVGEHMNEYKCIKQTSYYRYHKTPEHALKS